MRLFELEQKLVQEGGNAVPGVGRINQENVDATLKTIYNKLLPKLKVDVAHTASLGSTGKKAPGDSSGDIDMAISIQDLVQNNGLETPKEIYDFVKSVADSTGYPVRDMRGMGLISLAWPIVNVDGKQPDAKVQLDLMTVDSIDWARWAYYSPGFKDSPYKGLYRNELMVAVAKYMDYEDLETAMDKDGTEVPATWRRKFFDLGKGLMQGTQTRMGKNGITKVHKTIDKSIVSQDPEAVAKIMFGPDARTSDLLTFEQTFSAIMKPNFPYAENRQAILKMAKDGILNKGYPVPPELDKVA